MKYKCVKSNMNEGPLINLFITSLIGSRTLEERNQLLNAICSDIFSKRFQINEVHKVEADIKDILATAKECRNLAYSKRI